MADFTWPPEWDTKVLKLVDRDSVEDFTYSVPLAEFPKELEKMGARLKENKSEDGVCTIDGKARRFNAALSQEGTIVSFTVRAKADVSREHPTEHTSFRLSWNREPLKGFPLPLALITQYIWEAGLEAALKEDQAGVVLIVGRTGAAKSQVALDLIHRTLLACRSSDRRPHLITLEDPIEKSLYEFDSGKWWTEAASHFADYTPRSLRQDTNGPEEFFRSALRQTPTVAYVAETRKPEDWSQIIEFAGTGHLVLTTAHAGGVVEAMAKILDSLKCLDNPARKLYTASRLKAIIHLGPHVIKDRNDENLRNKVAFPSLWIGGQEAVSILSSDHLGGLLPASRHTSTKATTLRGQYSYVNWLLEKGNQCSKHISKEQDKITSRSRKKWDKITPFSREEWGEIIPFLEQYKDDLKGKAMKYDLQPH